jgi:EpsI family protein
MRELRLALVVAFLALPTALAVAARRSTDHLTFELADAPRELAGLAWSGDSELDEVAFKEVAPSAYLMRSFSDGKTEALAYVAFYTGFSSSGAHNPEVCYPAQGFDLGEVRDVAVELNDGSRLWAKIFRARQGAYEEVVLHWFQPLGRWPSTPYLEPWLRMLQAFGGRKAYAFVRVSVEIEVGAVTRAEDRAIAMGTDLAPWSRAVLSRAASVREEPAQARSEEARNGKRQVLPGA